MNKFLFLSLFCSSLFASEKYSESDVFVDKKTGKYLHICEKVGEELIVKEACGKHWEKFPRKREDLIKQVKEYKELKKNSLVMMQVKKSDGELHWVLGRVSFMYEDGRVDVMEYYSKRFGYNTGTLNWQTNYNALSKSKNTSESSDKKLICVKEDFDLFYSQDNSRKFSFKKGEQLVINNIFENNIASVSLQNKWDNFYEYGMNNQLPVEMTKLIECENETGDKAKVSVVDDARNSKVIESTEEQLKADKAMNKANEK
jgi:hypothetical protein